MVKFVFARVEEPTAPTWDCRETEWRTPANHEAPAEVDLVWRRQWDWHSGRTSERLEADGAAIPDLMAAMEEADPARQNALYTLAAMGEAAVAPLVADLAARTQDRWNEGVNVMENSAYALGALGAPAVPALIDLLGSPSEWVQINALFALGEIGSAAQVAYLPVLRKLRHPAHPVVRTALDALGQIGVLTDEALPDFRRLLLTDDPAWQTLIRRGWAGQDQVRTNAMMALLRLSPPSEAWTDLIIAALPGRCGYVGGFGVEILRRQNTPRALHAALDYLCAHRWDNTLKKGVRTF
jgi:HEAT repeat protein